MAGRSFAAFPTRAEWIVMVALGVIGVVMVGLPTWVITESPKLTTLMCLSAVAWVCVLAVPVIVFGYRNPIATQETQRQRDQDRVSLATRRGEPDGRSLKRRPGGRDAAEGGGAVRPLGNSEILLLPEGDKEGCR